MKSAAQEIARLQQEVKHLQKSMYAVEHKLQAVMQDAQRSVSTMICGVETDAMQCDKCIAIRNIST